MEHLRKAMLKNLSQSRFEHSLSVSYICISLAMRYGYDLTKAELAGILHDCAKRYDDTTIIEKCQKHKIKISESELLTPEILHAKYGAWMAKHKYGILDTEILEAICCHTTGKPDMSLLDKILYVADYIEPRRYEAPDLPRMRQMAYIDLDETLYQIMASTLQYLTQRGKAIDLATQDAYLYYKEFQKEKEGK